MIAMSTLSNQGGTDTAFNVPIIIDDDDESCSSGLSNRLRIASGPFIKSGARSDVATIQLNSAALAAMTNVAFSSASHTSMPANGISTKDDRVVTNQSSSIGPLIAHVGSLKEPGLAVSTVQISSIPSFHIARSSAQGSQIQTLTAIPAGQVTCIPALDGQCNTTGTGLPPNTILVLPSPLMQPCSVGQTGTTTTTVLNGSYPTPGTPISISSVVQPSPSAMTTVVASRSLLSSGIPTQTQQSPIQVTSGVANPPTYLNSSTAICPGHVHRLLLTPTDGNAASTGAKPADLAIVYLGQNCWRPIVLPPGFDAMNNAGPLLGRKTNN